MVRIIGTMWLLAAIVQGAAFSLTLGLFGPAYMPGVVVHWVMWALLGSSGGLLLGVGSDRPKMILYSLALLITAVCLFIGAEVREASFLLMSAMVVLPLASGALLTPFVRRAYPDISSINWYALGVSIIGLVAPLGKMASDDLAAAAFVHVVCFVGALGLLHVPSRFMTTSRRAP